MPELPEVEVTRQGLMETLPGKKVIKVSLSGKKLRSPIPGTQLNLYLPGNTIIQVDRRAKYLLFRLSDGSTLVIHLGMTGKLSFISAAEPRAKHDHLCLLLDDDMELRFNDSRRFGSVMFWPFMEAEEREKEFSIHIGMEPFSRKFNVSFLRQQSRTRKMPLKNFLMDARIIAGIGNIYANEILFAASLNPKKPANTVTPEEWKRIITATRIILKKAIKAGGSTISDFLGTGGNPGYFQVQFNVYNRAGKVCKKCSSTISKFIIGGRATYCCDNCQPMKVK